MEGLPRDRVDVYRAARFISVTQKRDDFEIALNDMQGLCPARSAWLLCQLGWEHGQSTH